MRRCSLALTLLIAISLSATAQELMITSENQFDWQRGTLVVSLVAEAGPDADLRPGFLHLAQQRLDAEFPNALFQALLPLRVDSVDLVHDIVLTDPRLASEIADLSKRAVPGLPRPYADLSGLTRSYEIPVFPDFVSLFVDHTIPFRMEEVISWVPTADFTGVVIYAADPIPFRGTGRLVFPAPALLPEIYDEDLRPVLEQDMLDPAAVRQHGVVAYSSETNEDPWRDRIGGNPLRIMAREAYGVHPTDLIIGREDADRLLASEHNRDLLRNGRILVVLDESRVRVHD